MRLSGEARFGCGLTAAADLQALAWPTAGNRSVPGSARVGAEAGFGALSCHSLRDLGSCLKLIMLFVPRAGGGEV
jgi:hypothetical protein